jgi:hypothetical protein
MLTSETSCCHDRRSEGEPMQLVRRVALGAGAGALVGMVVGGVWGRAFMAVLAALNAEDHGTRTDDGFRMGQFTVGGTLNLLVVTAVIGAIGGLVFLSVRGLRFGPAWFRTASVALGATLVVASMLVHADGVDFTRLEPVALAIALTLSVPLLYALGVSWLTDRWLGPGPTVWQRVPRAAVWCARASLTALAVYAAVDLVLIVADIYDGYRFD